MRVGEVCIRSVVTCLPDASAADVAALMRERHVGAVIVVEPAHDRGPRPLGIVTDRDLVLEVMAKGVDPATVKAGDLLVATLDTANECESVYDAVWHMRGKRIRRLPVVDDHGALVGVLSADDAARVLAEAMVDLTRMVPQQIERERSERP
ncbi:CBS domain-containing protein [Caldimonas sp. KR1-144]|uniref:CBS domain-containing protein n=1 Tax=Caldimonas sp. KR1-144 TaxID=3400911 RepID=UPI003BFB3B6B